MQVCVSFGNPSNSVKTENNGQESDNQDKQKISIDILPQKTTKLLECGVALELFSI